MNKSNFLTLWFVFALFSYKVAADDNADIQPDSNVTEPDELLDDMFYELDNDGDSRVPQILIPRDKVNDYVRLPDRDGEFEVVSRDEVAESRRLAGTLDAALYTKFLFYPPRGTGNEPVKFTLKDVASLPVRYGFNLNYDTKILCHGFRDNADHEVVGPLAAAFQATGDFNVIGIDWGMGAKTLFYSDARYRVPKVGELIAKLIDALIDLGLKPKQIGLIGHSLGAHIVGIAGKLTKYKVGCIFGLDPAAPLFRVAKKDERISDDDAEYVEIIHTDARAYGMYKDLGHVDIYVNGGMSQPGCTNNSCSHQRAPLLFKESLKQQNLLARRCPDLSQLSDKCSLDKTFLGGYNLSTLQQKVKGVYYMATASNAPYLVNV